LHTKQVGKDFVRDWILQKIENVLYAIRALDCFAYHSLQGGREAYHTWQGPGSPNRMLPRTAKN